MSGTLFLSFVALLAQVSFGSSEGDAVTVSHTVEVAQLRSEIAQLRRLLDAPATPSDASGRRLLVDPGNSKSITLPSGALTKLSVDTAMQRMNEHWQKQYTDLKGAMDSLWLILCGAMVMFMHPGFAMLETGCSRAKNAQSVLFKNLLNVTVGSLAWYIFGFAFAYGGPFEDNGKYLYNGFIGAKGFAGHAFLKEDDTGNMAISPGTSTMLTWFFQWAFCTAAATIVSGAVAQRVKSPAYAIYAFCMAGFIYPVVVAWTWNNGWIAKISDKVGYMDFAGSGVVHLTGGTGAFCGAAILGKRIGWYPDDPAFHPHNVPLVVLGTFILWFGWYGFNCGSTLGLHDAGTGALAAQVAMNTTVAASTGGIVVFAIRYAKLRKYDVPAMCNGILGGLVSITAGCGNVETGSALTIGFLGGIIYMGSSMLVEKAGIDDPVDASSVHGACGVWGLVAAALFDWGNGFDHFHGWDGFTCMKNDDGSCRTGIGGTALGVNIAMALVIMTWVGFLSTLIFLALQFTGLLRVEPAKEKKGADETSHSPSKAYNFSS